MHREMQETLARMDATTKDTLGTIDTGLKAILDRMDARAEQRYRDLKDRLDGKEAP